jgi:hypothetical protein
VTKAEIIQLSEAVQDHEFVCVEGRKIMNKTDHPHKTGMRRKKETSNLRLLHEAQMRGEYLNSWKVGL